MRVNINLASQKYEDVRRFYVRWGVTLAALAILVPLLAALSYVKHSRSEAAARQTTALQKEIAGLEQERNRLAAFENRPENKDVTQQKKYWNTQLARRSLSWTQLLNEMQRIMPRRAFLNSVQPEMTTDGRLKLTLTITGETQADARELQEKMEVSPRFYSTRPLNVSTVKDAKPGMPPTYKWEIETFYTLPGPALSPEPAPNQRGQVSRRGPRGKEGM
ncbi:MAG TPA: PilN domain-containing protein [Candidatus Angelobacter sp.]